MPTVFGLNSQAVSAGTESIGISSSANYQIGEENAEGLHLTDSLDIHSQKLPTVVERGKHLACAFTDDGRDYSAHPPAR